MFEHWNIDFSEPAHILAQVIDLGCHQCEVRSEKREDSRHFVLLAKSKRPIGWLDHQLQ